jgi:hypothetical protein
MLIIEMEQRKREQEAKRKAKEEQERMKLAEREQRKRSYEEFIKFELMAFEDNINTNIYINAVKWFVRESYGYHFDKLRVILDYHYMDNDCIHVESKTIDLMFNDNENKYVDHLRANLHKIFEENKSELIFTIEKKKAQKQLESKQFMKVKDPDDVCGICRSNYENNAYKLKVCDHIYHKECLIEWFINGQKRECVFCDKSVLENDN